VWGPGSGLHTIAGADTQVCPYIDSQTAISSQAKILRHVHFPFSVSRLSFAIAGTALGAQWQMTNVIWKMENERRLRLKILPMVALRPVPFPYRKLLNIAVTSDPSSPSADHNIRPPKPFALTYAPFCPMSVGSSYDQNSLPS